MNAKKLASILGITLLTAVSGLAQDKPGNIAALEFQTPKNGLLSSTKKAANKKRNGTSSRKTRNHSTSGKSSAASTPARTLSAD